MAEPRTYLDHNATAPLRPEARAAMLAALDVFGNASSVHSEGRRARGLVEDAREQVAALVGAKPEEVVFTSGATEANNWVMRAGWDALFVGATEHDSVLTPARTVDPELIELPCDANGLIDYSALHAMFSSPLLAGAELAPAKSGKRAPGRSLLSVHLANAETGVLQQIGKVVEVGRTQGHLVHSDAVQACGRVAIDFEALGLDFMSISAHKLGGPKGVGALVIRDGLDLPTQMAGGGQERRRRAGTENVASIAGFGAAAEAAKAGLGRMAQIAQLRDQLEESVRSITPAALVIGADAPRLPNTSCIALAGAEAATLLIKLDLAGIAVSAGSACSSGKIGGSHVLAAMGIDPALARGAIRASLGPTSTEHDIARFVAAWAAIHRAQAEHRHNRTAAGAISRPLAHVKAGE